MFSWFKVFLATILGLFLADGADAWAVDSGDLRTWIAAGFAATIPLIINFVNPADHRYGLQPVDIDEDFDESEYTGE